MKHRLWAIYWNRGTYVAVAPNEKPPRGAELWGFHAGGEEPCERLVKRLNDETGEPIKGVLFPPPLVAR